MDADGVPSPREPASSAGRTLTLRAAAASGFPFDARTRPPGQERVHAWTVDFLARSWSAEPPTAPNLAWPPRRPVKPSLGA